jgi:predicted GNAT family acetyltransferase
MPSIFDDPEAYAFSDDKEEDLRRKITNQQAFNAMLQGVGDLPYSLLGAPVEIGTGLLRSMGMAQGEQVGGIDYIKRKATELGIRPPDSTDPTMRDMRMGAEIVSGAIDPTRVARVGGVAATAAARKAAPMVGNAIENYMVKSGLAPRIVPEGGLLGSRAFDTTKVDASDIFGVGAQKTMYKDPESGGYIQVLTRPDQPASVTNLEVPEAFRNQGVGGRLQAQASKDFPNMQGQVSSKAAAKSAYKLGRRPVGQPDATLDDVLKIIDEDSSVNLVSPTRQQEISGTQGGLTRSLQQGFEHDWYHGTTGDIKSFDKGLLGEATGAPSASEGFFFARDPVSPPASMAQKTSDPKSIELLKKLGKSDKEIADINSVSMLGNGAETASGYAQLRGGRDYKAAMRKANAAEKRQDFDEYDNRCKLQKTLKQNTTTILIL